MSGNATPLPQWTESYALLRDRIATFPSTGQLRSVDINGEDPELLRYWPTSGWSPSSEYRRLILLGAPNTEVAESLKAAGWNETSAMNLLAAKPDDVEQVVKLAETSSVFEAPMDNYDVVEVAEFDRPVARGRMHYGSTYGLLSDPDLQAPTNPDLVRRAVLANFAGAAYSHGLPWILLVASADQLGSMTEGWSKATSISIWQQS
ncbi:hypothetical protein ACX5K5_01770 [Glutamicibacter bergerei]|jgi:hypothetical protein|uniref:Nitroreductase domain-containing protein n=4 Tax=Glutamicibacter TaxID=1742989 RepID=A0ABV9MLM4_9MICC|nr:MULTISPECIES: hypothetical protein [Glutamicibacter]PCC31641.1 hypothetical protein CIK74_16830 [Glutamicibacter sp. BW77]GGJ71925.1 hypothetical protein GCM10007173_33530 [Glutamicibacter ardleyensis]HBV11197.1 hypothetical protein [Micrococcaceae bacterium]